MESGQVKRRSIGTELTTCLYRYARRRVRLAGCMIVWKTRALLFER